MTLRNSEYECQQLLQKKLVISKSGLEKLMEKWTAAEDLPFEMINEKL